MGLYCTKYVFGEIVAVNQIDSQDGNALTAPAEPLSVPVNGDLLCMDASATTIVPATHIVLMSGADNADEADVEVVELEAQNETPAYEYNVAVTDVTYNGIAAEVVRITGLDPAAVSVTVAGTTAKYYTRTTDNANVIVACIAKDSAVDYTDAGAVKALVSIEAGTTDTIRYGNANGDTRFNTNDSLTLKRQVLGTIVRDVPAALPTDLMSLHLLDVDANGRVNTNDSLAIKRAALGTTVRNVVMNESNMTCYTK